MKKISKKRATELRLEAKLRIYHYERQKGKCARCPRRGFLQLSHKIPKARGGESTIENTELLCIKCHGEDEHGLSINLDSQPMWRKG